MLLLGPLCSGITEGAPGNNGELGNLSIGVGLSLTPGVLVKSGLGNLNV